MSDHARADVDADPAMKHGPVEIASSSCYTIKVTFTVKIKLIFNLYVVPILLVETLYRRPCTLGF